RADIRATDASSPTSLDMQAGFKPTAVSSLAMTGKGSVRARDLRRAHALLVLTLTLCWQGAECAQHSSRNTVSNRIARFTRHAARIRVRAIQECGAGPFGPLSG